MSSGAVKSNTLLHIMQAWQYADGSTWRLHKDLRAGPSLIFDQGAKSALGLPLWKADTGFS